MPGAHEYEHVFAFSFLSLSCSVSSSPPFFFCVASWRAQLRKRRSLVFVIQTSLLSIMRRVRDLINRSVWSNCMRYNVRKKLRKKKLKCSSSYNYGRCGSESLVQYKYNMKLDWCLVSIFYYYRILSFSFFDSQRKFLHFAPLHSLY